MLEEYWRRYNVIYFILKGLDVAAWVQLESSDEEGRSIVGWHRIVQTDDVKK